MKRALRLAVLAVGSVLVICRGASADALLLKDGRFITGDVTHTSSGYVVKTRDGVEKFSDDEVEHWARSHSSDAGPSDPGTGTSGSPPSGPAATPSASQFKANKTFGVLLSRGNEAMAAADYNAARNAFADALSLSPRDATAAQGLGFCLLQLKSSAKARDALEIAYASVHPLPRSLAANLAVALTQTHNPMRAAKVLREYLSAHPELLDEPALNALAGAMFSADEMTQRNGFFMQMAQFYETYNGKLEATRPGEKRWGTTWLDSTSANKMLLAYNKKRAQVTDLNRRMTAEVASGKAAEDAAAEAVNDARFDAQAKRLLPGQLAEYERQMNEAKAAYERDSKALEKAKASVEDPPIDTSLAVVVPESAAAAVASAGAASPGTSTPSVPAAVETPPPSAVRSTPAVRPTAAAPAVIAAAPIEPPVTNRKHRVSIDAVAFPVGPDLLVTSSEAVSDASSISITLPNGDDAPAEFVSDEKSSGLALVRLTKKKMAYLPLGNSYAGGGIQCFSFPEVSLFNPTPVSLAGSVSAAGSKWTLSLTKSPRLGGGPIVAGNEVVGVELASRDSDLKSIPVATLDDLKRLVGDKVSHGGSPAGTIDAKSLIVQLTAVRER